MNLASPKVLAKTLGVSGNQIYTWHQRRHRNGFPEAVAASLVSSGRGGRKRFPLFDLGEVLAWYEQYVPSRGGAPRGNNNYLNGLRRRRREASA